jgi:hypothetical protein
MKNSILIFFLILNMNLFAQKAITPDKGSSDRKVILDILRKDFGEEKNQILFKVNHFLISGSWACVMVTPLKNNSEEAEPRWNLLNRVGEKWKIVNWSKGIEIQDDFELIDLPIQNQRIAKLIIKKYPTCPMAIFGK